MKKEVVLAIMMLVLSILAYSLGRSQVKTEIVTKKVEVIKYVQTQKAKIYSRPNAARSELLELMQLGKL